MKNEQLNQGKIFELIGIIEQDSARNRDHGEGGK